MARPALLLLTRECTRYFIGAAELITAAVLYIRRIDIYVSYWWELDAGIRSNNTAAPLGEEDRFFRIRYVLFIAMSFVVESNTGKLVWRSQRRQQFNVSQWIYWLSFRNYPVMSKQTLHLKLTLKQLGGTIGNGNTENSNIFFYWQEIFREKLIRVILLGTNALKTHKIWSKSLEPFLGKFKIKIFFLCELSLILRVGRKRKDGRDRSVRLGATLGDGQSIKKYFSSFRNFAGKSR